MLSAGSALTPPHREWHELVLSLSHPQRPGVSVYTQESHKFGSVRHVEVHGTVVLRTNDSLTGAAALGCDTMHTVCYKRISSCSWWCVLACCVQIVVYIVQQYEPVLLCHETQLG